MVQPGPRAPLEMIQAQLFFQVLVALLTTPACLDRSDDRARRCMRAVVGEVELALSGRAALSNEPDFVARQVLSESEGGAIGDPHPHEGKSRPQLTLRALPPTHRAPTGA